MAFTETPYQGPVIEPGPAGGFPRRREVISILVAVGLMGLLVVAFSWGAASHPAPKPVIHTRTVTRTIDHPVTPTACVTMAQDARNVFAAVSDELTLIGKWDRDIIAGDEPAVNADLAQSQANNVNLVTLRTVFDRDEASCLTAVN